MKTSLDKRNRQVTVLMLCAALVALAVPAARGQSADEFQQLKDAVQQMQKTIDGLNKRIAEMEKSKAASPLAPSATLTNSRSIQTIEKIAAGEKVAEQSPITFRDALNDQQEAASRPKD